MTSGFDRLLFRGSLRPLNHSGGMEVYLHLNNILFKDYQQHVKAISLRLKQASVDRFRNQSLPVEFLRGKQDKDARARHLAAQRGITCGDVCLLSALELSPTFEHEGTHMVMRKRPCLTLYHYLVHPQFGWMHARIQTWFPFFIHVYLNGGEWLARRMDREKLDYVRQDNCFPWIEDYGWAQQLLDEQLKTNWEACLRPFAQRLSPLHRAAESEDGRPYSH